MEFKIFVEGKADLKFLQDYINENFGKMLTESNDFIITGGFEKLFDDKNITALQKNAHNEIRNIVIFDTDGNYAKKIEYLDENKERYKVDFDLFLLPNNKDTGNLEALLLQMANYENHEFYFDCFDDLINCLKKGISPEKIQNFEVPDLKAKVFTYLSFFKQDAKEEKRDYQNKDFWNLHHEATLPLKSFLDKYFQQ